MRNIVEANYEQTGASTNTNPLGMRQMQERAYNARFSDYLLLKAPPASGKSRALMFLALDKLKNQSIKKVIVAVPERSIGGSFSKTDLRSYGFFSDWEPNPEYNLCVVGKEGSKRTVQTFKNFMQNEEEILICTHATLRFACDEIDAAVFNNCLLAIDEFHHVSADTNNRLGEHLKDIMQNSDAHIIAMTGSYFRGDSVPVLLPEDEAKFTKVTYNYYEQLNGYKYLKSLGIGYHFYQGRYTTAIMEVLDTDKKTILHIPSPNAGESTKDKYKEVDTIIDLIGTIVSQDPFTGVITLKRHTDGKLLKVADLVYDEKKDRDRVIEYLRNIEAAEDMDLIIALGMAKEGFDWPYCEHALTVGYRGSLTEVIQIIGRATRDSDNKTHAQFTNLIAQPDAEDDVVKNSVNNLLKAITASLLMEQVLAPNWKFKTKVPGDKEEPEPGVIKIRGLKKHTNRVKEIVKSDLQDIQATILQDETVQQGMAGRIDPEVINTGRIPMIIKEKYPDLSDDEIKQLSQVAIVDSFVKNGEKKPGSDQRFIKMAGKFINVEDIHIDLIEKVNPFQKAFEVMSKSVNTKVLKVIQDTFAAKRIRMTEEEVLILYPKIKEFIKTHNKKPNINSVDPLEVRMAEAIVYINNKRRSDNG